MLMADYNPIVQIVNRVRHPDWVAVVLPLALAIGSTFTPGTLRVWLLVAAVGAATWIFYNTELGAKNIVRTIVASFVFLLIAAAIFLTGRRYDASRASITTQSPSASQNSSVQEASKQASSQVPTSTPHSPIKPGRQTKKPQVRIPSRSIQQTNFGGVNVQQATTGNNSPIVNSPITVNQDWGLSKKQLEDLTHRMAPFAENVDRGDLISCVWGDPDSMRFAYNLVAAFRAAGWKLSGSGLNQNLYDVSPTGVVIVLNSRQANPPGLHEFLRTLREAGIRPIGQINPKIPVDRFEIVVGRKP